MLQKCCFATTNKPKEAASSCGASTVYGLHSPLYNLLTHPFHFRCHKWQFPSTNQLNFNSVSIIFVGTLGQVSAFDVLSTTADTFSEFHWKFWTTKISKTSPLRLDPPSCHSSAPVSGHPAWSPGHTPMLNSGSDPAGSPESCLLDDYNTIRLQGQITYT